MQQGFKGRWLGGFPIPIFLCVIKDAKANIFKDMVTSSSGGTPKIAICGQGLKDTPRVSEMDLKNDCQ